MWRGCEAEMDARGCSRPDKMRNERKGGTAIGKGDVHGNPREKWRGFARASGRMRVAWARRMMGSKWAWEGEWAAKEDKQRQTRSREKRRMEGGRARQKRVEITLMGKESRRIRKNCN